MQSEYGIGYYVIISIMSSYCLCNWTQKLNKDFIDYIISCLHHHMLTSRSWNPTSLALIDYLSMCLHHHLLTSRSWIPISLVLVAYISMCLHHHLLTSRSWIPTSLALVAYISMYYIITCLHHEVGIQLH